MAKIGLSTKQFCNVPSVATFYVKATLGVTSVTKVQGKGCKLVRASAGTYTVTLDKPYAELVSFKAGVFSPAGTVVSGRVTAKTLLATNGVLTVVVANAAGAATDGAANDEVYLTITVVYDGVKQVF